jgi:hypothetical protein
MASSSSSSCGANIWVRLKPEFQRDYVVGTSKGFRLRIVADDACGTDKNVFRYYKKPLNAQGVSESVLSGVCSWPDMEELPIGEPEDDTSPAGFRLAYMDIVVDSETMATEIWALIKTQVAELVQTIKDGQELESAADYTAVSI